MSDAAMFERGSPEEAKYKALIFNKLSSLGLENETLADYVVVMLANRKSRDHVASDLASIVGDELPTAFVPWLFDELLAGKVDAQNSAATSASAPAATVEQQTQSPVFTFHSGAAALDPEAAEFVPEEEEGLGGAEADAEMDTSGGGSGAAKPAKTPYRLLDKALREAATSKPAVPTPPASAAANARSSPRAAPYSVAGSKARQAKTVTETATTFTVTLAGESALERVEERPVRCVFWPDCAKGNECPFFHPSEVCPNLPNCPDGNKCIYIHPQRTAPCKYGAGCTNPRCTFQHPTPAAIRKTRGGGPMRGAQRSNVPCKFDGSCLNPRCPFVHSTPSVAQLGFANKTLIVGDTGEVTSVSEIPCKYEPFCTRPGCPYKHSAAAVEPVRRSERSFAVAEAEESLADMVE